MGSFRLQRSWGTWMVAAVLGLLAPGCPSSVDDSGPKPVVEPCDKGAQCGNSCVNLSKSVDHCGACGLACNSTDLCSSGTCVMTCPVWAAVCGNYCANLRKDRDDCGGCGIACKDGEVCATGICAMSCEEGTEECEGTCANYLVDRDSCGSCGTVCGQGEVCSNGTCAVSCQAELRECDGLCVNVKTSPENCGACGTACAAGWVCSDGACALSCQVGLSECNGTCVDTSSDNAHCGECNSVCGPGKICSGGICEVTCQQGLTECEGICVKTDRDPEHCGSCSNECAEGEVCAGGSCDLSCGPGVVECAGGCVDVSCDPAHCGECARACAAAPHAKAACLAGTCVYVCEAGRYDGDGDAANGCESAVGTGGSGGTGGAGGTGGSGGTGGAGGTGGSGGTGGTGGTGGSGGMTYGVDGQSCAAMSGTECQGKSCCENILLAGGTFRMGRSLIGTDAYGGGSVGERPEHDVTVSGFYLDTYEVTVGRFRKFVEQYDGTKPAAGDGKHPQIGGSGWQAAWDSDLPADQAALRINLKCYAQDQTWTDTEGGTERYPINCVSWYESFAFCVWDGGRLPTEAEWEYASAGGTDNRLYPWGKDAPSATKANFFGSDNSPYIEVGSHAAGAGRWGHQDLAGSMWEWALDWYDSDWYAGGGFSCNDCANLSDTGARVYRGGDWYFPDISDLRAAYRIGDGPSYREGSIGFRCAR